MSDDLGAEINKLNQRLQRGGSTRPLPPHISTREAKPEASFVKDAGTQLGTDIQHLGEGKFDERKLSYIGPQERIAFAYWHYLNDRYGNSFWGRMVDNLEVLSQSVEGKRTRDIIQMANAESGTSSQKVAERPGWVGRNLTKRDWKERAQRDGMNIPEEIR